jgi:hypothetical protein
LQNCAQIETPGFRCSVCRKNCQSSKAEITARYRSMTVLNPASYQLPQITHRMILGPSYLPVCIQLSSERLVIGILQIHRTEEDPTCSESTSSGLPLHDSVLNIKWDGENLTGLYGYGPHCTVICTIVIELTMIWVIMQTIIEKRNRRLLWPKHERRNHIMPVLEIMAAATAISSSACLHFHKLLCWATRHTARLRGVVIFQCLHLLLRGQIVEMPSQAPCITILFKY